MGCSQCIQTKGGPDSERRKPNNNTIQEINVTDGKKDETNKPNQSDKSNKINNPNNPIDIQKTPKKKSINRKDKINTTTIEKTVIIESTELDKKRKPSTYIDKNKINFPPNEIDKKNKDKGNNNNKEEEINNKITKILLGDTVITTEIINNNTTNIFNIITNNKQYYHGTLVGSSNPEINVFSQHNLGYSSKNPTKIDKKSQANINTFQIHESNNPNVCDNDIQGIINGQNLN